MNHKRQGQLTFGIGASLSRIRNELLGIPEGAVITGLSQTDNDGITIFWAHERSW